MFLTVHSDGIIFNDNSGYVTVDIFSFILSSKGTDQLLAVRKSQSGTGPATASALIEALFDVETTEQAKYMIFDIIFVNIGLSRNAFALLEQNMNQ